MDWNQIEIKINLIRFKLVKMTLGVYRPICNKRNHGDF